MKIINFLTILFFIITISCTQSGKKTQIDNKIKKYSIAYTNNSFIDLVVFDNNDTIYVTNSINRNIVDYEKIKSDMETVNEVKKCIVNHLVYKTMFIKRDYILHSGYLSVSMSSHNGEKIELSQGEVNSDLNVSKNFYFMINHLKLKHKEIEKAFKNF